MSPRLVIIIALFAALFGVAPTQAAHLQCADPAVATFVNASLRSVATFGDGTSGRAKGLLQVFRTPRDVSASKDTLVCDADVRHNFPTGGSEVLTARLTLTLRHNGTIDHASMVILKGSN